MNHDIILNEIKNKTWIETGNEGELKKKIAYWKERLLELFRKDHEVFSMLAEISFEPEAVDSALYKHKKQEAIEKDRKALGRLFDQIPELYDKIPLVDKSFEEIIKRDESHYLEYKPSMTRGTGSLSGPDRIMMAIAAFLNSDGGVLVIGVDDNKNIIGINRDYSELNKYKPPRWTTGFKQDKDGFENCFTTLIKRYGFSNGIIAGFVANGIEFHNINNLDVCMIRIKKSDEPVVIKIGNKHEFYVREANSSRSLMDVREIAEYVFKHFQK